MSALPDFSSAARRGGDDVAGRDRAWLIAGVLAIVLAGTSVAYQQADLDAARAELQSARRASASELKRPKRRPGADELRAQGLLAQQRTTAAAPPAQVLAELQGLQPQGVRFERIGLRYGPELALDLDVVARTAADYDRLLLALEKSKAFADVTPGAENREGEVRSTLSLRYAGGAR